MSNGNGHSWSKLVWKDWMTEPTLRACGYAARGLWMDMLCLAHDGAPIGHITLNGNAPTLGQLASMLGGKEREVGKLLAELEAAGVFSRTTDGIIYSRRMVKDTRAAEQAKVWGKTGGNPTLGEKEAGPKKSRGGLTPPLTTPLTSPLNPSLNGGVNAKNLESRKKKEERRNTPYPNGAAETGTPQAGTPPGHRHDGTNPRTLGTNPRETGENLRAWGINPRKTGANPRNRDDDLDRMREAVRQARVARLGVDEERKTLA